MNIKSSWLTLGLIAAMTGCIDSGSDDAADDEGSNGGDGGAATVERISFSGLVADGYLDGARVCLDINKNKKCDADDPTATSGAGGKFTIEGATKEQRDTFALLVEVVVGTTTDEDNAGVVLTKPLTLSAPAGYGFISPLSTMVQSKVESGSTPVEAKKAVQDKLGTTLDLDSDYIAGKASGANAEDYKRLHQVAQVTARVISDNIVKLQAVANDPANNISIEDLISAIVDEVFEALDEITKQVEVIAADPEADFNPDTVAQAVDEEVIDLEPDTVAGVIEQNKAQEAATTVDMSALLLAPGLTGFWAEIEYGSLSADYWTIYNDTNGDFKSDELEWSGNGFVSPTGTPDTDYILKASGWVVVTDFDTPDSMVGGTDGTITITKAGGDVITRLISTEVDLTGLNTRTVMNRVEDGDGIWGEYLDSGATFPAGSKGYTLADNGSDVAFIFEDGDWCDGSLVGGLCAYSYVQNGPNDGQAQSFADIESSTAYSFTGTPAADIEGIKGVEIAYTNTHKLWAEIVTGGVVNYYKVGKDHSTPDVSFLGASTWSAVALNPAAAIELELIPGVLSFGDIAEDGNVILGLIAGYIRQTDLDGGGDGDSEPQIRLLNKTAADAVTGVNFSLANAPLELSALCEIGNTAWVEGVNTSADIFSTAVDGPGWNTSAEFNTAVIDCLVDAGDSAEIPFIEADVKDIRVRNLNINGSATYLANNKGVFSGPEGQTWFDWTVINERLVLTYPNGAGSEITLTYAQLKRDLTQAYSQSKRYFKDSAVTAFADANVGGQEFGNISVSAGELSSVAGTTPDIKFDESTLAGAYQGRNGTNGGNGADLVLTAGGTGTVHVLPTDEQLAADASHAGVDAPITWMVDTQGRLLVTVPNFSMDRYSLISGDQDGGTIRGEGLNSNGLYQHFGDFTWKRTGDAIAVVAANFCATGNSEWDGQTTTIGAEWDPEVNFISAIDACRESESIFFTDAFVSSAVSTSLLTTPRVITYLDNGRGYHQFTATPQANFWFDWVVNPNGYSAGDLELSYNRPDNGVGEDMTIVAVADGEAKVLLRNDNVTASATASAQASGWPVASGDYVWGLIFSSATEFTNVNDRSTATVASSFDASTIAGTYIWNCPEGACTFIFNTDGTGTVNWPAEVGDTSSPNGYTDLLEWHVTPAGRLLLTLWSTTDDAGVTKEQLDAVERYTITAGTQSSGTVTLEGLGIDGEFATAIMDDGVAEASFTWAKQ
jgi:hypothetical protein